MHHGGDHAAERRLRPARPDQVASNWTLADLQKEVTQTVSGNGGWVVLTFHHICSNIGAVGCEADQSISPTTYNAFVSWLKTYVANSANKTSVKTVDQAVRGYLGTKYPAYVTPFNGPARPAAAPGVNALANPSLETTNTATTFPTCFQPAGWGTNAATWSATTAAHTGTAAEQLDLTGYSSGDAKLMPIMDLGSCTPTVTPGVSYNLSTWYTSTAVSQYALYYRDASGAWYYWTSSPWFAASSTWAQATFTTPPAPANATGASFGLALIANGTLVTDDYSFVQPAAGGAAVTASAMKASAVSPSTVSTSAVRGPIAVAPAPQPIKPIKPIRVRVHSHDKPFLPGAGKVAPGTRVAPPS